MEMQELAHVEGDQYFDAMSSGGWFQTWVENCSVKSEGNIHSFMCFLQAGDQDRLVDFAVCQAIKKTLGWMIQNDDMRFKVSEMVNSFLKEYEEGIYSLRSQDLEGEMEGADADIAALYFMHSIIDFYELGDGWYCLEYGLKYLVRAYPEDFPLDRFVGILEAAE